MVSSSGSRAADVRNGTLGSGRCVAMVEGRGTVPTGGGHRSTCGSLAEPVILDLDTGVERRWDASVPERIEGNTVYGQGGPLHDVGPGRDRGTLPSGLLRRAVQSGGPLVPRAGVPLADGVYDADW